MTSDRPDRNGRGRDSDGVPPPARPWRERLADPDEPLFTLAIVADLLGLDTQVIRRLGDRLRDGSPRPSGNQRRYSRTDLEALDQALTLAEDGHNSVSIRHIMDLERRLAAVDADDPAEESPTSASAPPP